MNKKCCKLIAALLAVVLLLAALPLNAFAAETYQRAGWKFKDVSTDWWSFPYIKLLYDGRVIDGTSATTFEPSANVTRAQFVKMLGCVAGINPADYSGSSFKDVKKSAWYAPYVEWAVQTGVTTGTYPGMFQPNAHILRQDIATMIYRYVTAAKVSLPTDGKVRTFIDEKEIASYAKDAVVAMQQAEIISGEKNKDKTYSFHPTDKATREQTAKMLCVLNEVQLEKLWTKNTNKYYYTLFSNWILANTNRDYYGCPAYTETVIKEDNYQENFTIYLDKGLKSWVYMIEIYDGDWVFRYTGRRSSGKGDNKTYYKFTASTKGETYIECIGKSAPSDVANEVIYIDSYNNDTNLPRKDLEKMIISCRTGTDEFRTYLLEYQLCRGVR